MNSNDEESPDHYDYISKRKNSRENIQQTKTKESYNHSAIGDKNKKRKIGMDNKRKKKFTENQSTNQYKTIVQRKENTYEISVRKEKKEKNVKIKQKETFKHAYSLKNIHLLKMEVKTKIINYVIKKMLT